MAKNLTTRYLFKLHANITLTNTTDDDLIDELINQVSDAIANRCGGRTWEATGYKQWFDGTDNNKLLLPNWPITNIYGVAVRSVNAGDISFTGSGTFATVSNRDGTLYLDSITDGTESHDTVDLTGLTITTLETAVELISGWSMTVESENANDAAVLIRPFEGVFAVTPDDVTLEIPDETVPAMKSADSRQMIERQGGFLFPMGLSNVWVWFKAGYTLPAPMSSNSAPTTEGNVPEDLTMICNQIIKAVYDAGKEKSGGLKSEKIGNYSYTLDGAGRSVLSTALDENEAALSNHKSARYM